MRSTGGRCRVAALTFFDSYGEGLAFCAVHVGDFAGHPVLQDLGRGLQGHGTHHLATFQCYRLKGGKGGALIDPLTIRSYFAVIPSISLHICPGLVHQSRSFTFHGFCVDLCTLNYTHP